MRFERQLYQVFGLELGRPLRLKAVMYFFTIAAVESALYFTPGIGWLINWIPVGILIIIPIGLAWLLADVGTEGRSPIYFFRSFIFYQVRKLKNITFYRGREVDEERDYQFYNYFTYKRSIQKEHNSAGMLAEINKEHAQVNNYLARISNRVPVISEMLGPYSINKVVVMEFDNKTISEKEVVTKSKKKLF
ncbi:TcpE family conjugal transfer membrane protein [Sporosarcina sp. 179-K 3D1 HS]|uniref:TcpE family conjugal transfer membrane protein n=1 Tax=Sporosarcina sp. 179-K 3D1 HS TaxID=3232169 RepID=UPI00399FD631